MTALVADIGGTKTLVRLLEIEDRAPGAILGEQRYRSADFPDFATLVGHFLKEAGHPAVKIDTACLAVAGPVVDSGDNQTVAITNLPWEIDANRLAGRLKISQLQLVNDFQAIAYALDDLGPQDLETLHDGVAGLDGPRLIVGAGTGLGIAQLWVDAQGQRHVLASEGGHADFAPGATPTQWALARYLGERYGHVAVERVLSGQGLHDVYRFLRQTQAAEAGELDAAIEAHGSDPAALISDYALQHHHGLANQALDLFFACFGAQVGNYALYSLPFGGIFLAGGIAAKNLEAITRGGFMQAFLNKSKMVHLLERMPVSVILNPRAGLIGAARIAAGLEG